MGLNTRGYAGALTGTPQNPGNALPTLPNNRPATRRGSRGTCAPFDQPGPQHRLEHPGFRRGQPGLPRSNDELSCVGDQTNDHKGDLSRSSQQGNVMVPLRLVHSGNASSGGGGESDVSLHTHQVLVGPLCASSPPVDARYVSYLTSASWPFPSQRFSRAGHPIDPLHVAAHFSPTLFRPLVSQFSFSSVTLQRLLAG